MDFETSILIISVVTIEIFVAAGVWGLLRWARSGAIRRELTYILRDPSQISALREIASGVNLDLSSAIRAYMEEPMEVDAGKGQTVALPRSQVLIAQFAQNVSAAGIAQLKAWLHGAGCKDEDIVKMIQAIGRFSGSGGGEGGGLGGAMDLIGEGGELNLMGIAKMFLGGMGGGGAPRSTGIPAAGGGRIDR